MLQAARPCPRTVAAPLPAHHRLLSPTQQKRLRLISAATLHRLASAPKRLWFGQPEESAPCSLREDEGFEGAANDRLIGDSYPLDWLSQNVGGLQAVAVRGTGLQSAGAP
jgi:hypothetical protein